MLREAGDILPGEAGCPQEHATLTTVSALWEEGQAEKPGNGRPNALPSIFSPKAFRQHLLVLTGS